MRILYVLILLASGLSCATFDKISEDLAGEGRPPGDDCQANYSECLTTPLGGKTGSVYGESICQSCFDRCKGDGYWPNWVQFTKERVNCQWWQMK